MNKVLVDLAVLDEAVKWLEVHSPSPGSAEAFVAEALREAIVQPAEAEGVVERQRMIESMCLTWRHDFGLNKPEDCEFSSGMTVAEREHLRDQMAKLFDHHFRPALSAVTAEAESLRKDAERYRRIKDCGPEEIDIVIENPGDDLDSAMRQS